jgi:hypothetical protein
LFYIGDMFYPLLTDGGVTGGPDFSGKGVFTVDENYAPAQFFGVLKSGSFQSNSPLLPAAQSVPIYINIQLPLIPGVAPLMLKVNGSHIRFDAGTDMQSSQPGLLNGQLHGSIKISDVQNTIIPAAAMLLTQWIAQERSSGNASMIEQLFDTGGCTNSNGSMAKAMDYKIESCELATNNILKPLLVPDIQVYDADGNYAPNKLNTTPDSLSLGLGFTAVKADFPE